MATEDIERLVVSLEANTAKLDKALMQSNTIFAKQAAAMETRASTLEQRLTKALGLEKGSASAKGLTAALEQGQGALGRYAGNLGPLGAILETVGGGWLAAGAAAGGFAYLLEQGTEKAAAYEQRMLTVESVLRATGDASGESASDIAAMAEKISTASLQSRDDVMAAAAELLTFRDIGPESFEPVLTLAADMSQVFGIDMRTAVVQLGKAFEDPVRGLVSLRREGIDFSAAETQMIERMAKTGDAFGAQKVMMAAVEQQIGGAAAGAHGGLSGAVHDLGEAWDKFLVDLSGSAHSGGIVEEAIDGITGAIKKLDDQIKNSGGAAEFLARLAGAAATGNITAFFPPGTPASEDHGTPAPRHIPGYADVMKQFGPAIAQDEKQQELVNALGQVVDDMKAKAAELKKTPLAQAIDKALDEAAEKAGISRQTLDTDPAYSEVASQIRAAATEEYNLGQARKDGAKATKDAAEAARQAAEAEKKLADERQDGWKTIDDLTRELKSKSGQPGAERQSAIDDEVAKIKTPLSDSVGLEQRGEVSQLAGEKFDAATLDEQIDKGKDLVRNYQDQTAALGEDRAAAEAAKYEHDALIEIYQKTGTVSQQAAAAVHAQAQAILSAGQAAEKASEESKDQLDVTDSLRSGLEKLGETGAQGFRGLKDAAHEFVLQMAELIIKLYVMQPLLDSLLGPSGTTGGGLLGGALSGGLDQLSGGGSGGGGGSAGGGLGGSLLGGLFHSVGNIFGLGGGSDVTPELANYLGGLSGQVAPLSDAAIQAAMPSWTSSLINTVPTLSFARGGRIKGPGGPRDDGIRVHVSNGEYIVNAEQTSRHLDLLDAINGGALPRFASGGMVGRVSVPKLPSREQMRTSAHTFNVAPVFNVDARGAQEGVADQIDAKLRDAAPAIIGASLAQFEQRFPTKLSETLRDQG